MLTVLLTFLLLLTPTVYAAEGTAGFLEHPIWHTPETYYVGDTVRIYAALLNNSAADLSGTLEFQVNGEVIGTRPFTMQAQDPVTTVWYDWIAAEGTHTFTAHITDTSFTVESKTTETRPRVVATAPAVTATTSERTKKETSEASSTSESTTLGNAFDTATAKARESLEEIHTALQDKIATQKARVAGTSTIAEVSFIPNKLSTAVASSAVRKTPSFFAKVWLFMLQTTQVLIGTTLTILRHPLLTALTLVVIFMVFMKLTERLFRLIARKRS